MSTGEWVAAVLLAALPAMLHISVLWRSAFLRLHFGLFVATMGAAAAMVLPVALLEQLLQRWAQIDPMAHTGGAVTLLLYGALVVAPLEMACVVLAVVPFWRLRRIRMRAGLSRALEIQEGVGFAAGAAIGFATLRNAVYLWLYGTGWLSVARAGLSLSIFTLLCAGWGYVLGRHAARGFGGRRFSSAVLGATVFSAVCDQLIFQHGVLSLMAVLPLLASMLAVAFVLWRDARGRDTRSSSGTFSSIFISAPAPSLAAIREAFRQQDRPLTLRWISFGALVTTGMITAGITGAVLLGHKLGLDFSAVDRPGGSAQALAPLALLGLGALAAFPSSGYLLARASGTRSVLEPAMAAALALVVVLALLGMAAPVSVVFVIALSPIAFGLSCVGAWVGLGN